jgi:hypothetical protein
MDVYMNLHTTPLNLHKKKKITKFPPNPTPKDGRQTININLIHEIYIKTCFKMML